MQRVAAQRRIVFFDLQLFGLQFLVAGGCVAGGRFAFLARLGAFNRNNFAGHNKTYSFSLGFSSGSSSSSVSGPATASTVPRAPRRRWRKAPSRSSCAWACTVKRVQGIASSRLLGIGLPVNSQVP